MNKMPIRVLLVEDSPVALVILKRILAASPDIEVVGTARHGREEQAKGHSHRSKDELGSDRQVRSFSKK